MQMLSLESEKQDQWQDLSMTRQSQRNFNVSQGVTIKFENGKVLKHISDTKTDRKTCMNTFQSHEGDSIKVKNPTAQ